VLIFSEFQAAGAAAENTHEEKSVKLLTCGRCSSGAEAERDILDDTPQFHRKYMTVVQFVLHERLLLQSCKLYTV